MAVIKALDFPRPGKRILELAKDEAPKINYFDLRHILRKLQEQGLVECLNFEDRNGRIYQLTKQGTEYAGKWIEGFESEDLPYGTDIALYAMISRSKSQTAVLLNLYQGRMGPERKTPTQIRKSLQDHYSISLSWVIASLSKLCDLGLVSKVRTDARDERLSYYVITPRGRLIAHLIEK